jgi:hypothetical protein
MTVLAQIENKGAVTAWSASAASPGTIAVGTKDSGGIGFDDYGGELELHDLNLTKTSDVPVAPTGTCVSSGESGISSI